MSGAIRDKNQLLALRVRLQPGRGRSGEASVQFDLFGGENRLWDETLVVPAQKLGIPKSLTFEAVKENYDWLRPTYEDLSRLTELGDALSGIDNELSAEEPMWLQLSRGSGYLAVLPWELILRQVTRSDLPVFRIPNFLGDPYFLEGDLRIAICASSPSTKVSYQSPEVIDSLVSLVREAFPEGADIHVFADQGAYEETMHLSTVDGPVKVTVHDPEGAKEYGLGASTLREQSGQLTSPWLLWMEDALGGRRTDCVHFVSPGYFTGDLGGLALAHSPLGDAERRRAHFVSATELNTFLNTIGAWAVFCTVPDTYDPWNIGVRIFAEQLARRRPEPILIHELAHTEFLESPYEGLANAYAFLFGPPDADVERMTGIGIYAHPQRLRFYAEREELKIESISFSASQQDLDSEYRLTPLVAKSGATRLPEGSSWMANVQLDVEQSFLQLASEGIETPEEKGEARALKFLAEALQSREPGS